MNYGHFLGLFYSFLSSVALTVSYVFVKMMTYINPGQLSIVRHISMFAGSLPLAIYYTNNIFGPKKYRLTLVLRSFLASTALYFNIMAFRYLPLAEAAIILSTLPAVVTILARVYLKEVCGLLQIFAVVLTAIGVLLSIRLPELLKNRENTEFDSSYILGLSCAIGSVLLISITYLLLRKLKEVHFSIVLFYFGFLRVGENVILTYVTSYFVWPICGLDPILVTLIGIFGLLGQGFFTPALQQESAGIVSVINASSQIVVSMVCQVVFFKENIDHYNICGALLVIVSVGFIGLGKWLITLPEDSDTRRRLRYILL